MTERMGAHLTRVADLGPEFEPSTNQMLVKTTTVVRILPGILQ